MGIDGISWVVAEAGGILNFNSINYNLYVELHNNLLVFPRKIGGNEAT